MDRPFLSIIIPAHNEEARLPGALEQVTAFLDRQAYRAEILVVENGSQDRTLQIAEEWSRRDPRVKARHEAQPGKGGAIQRGVLEAAGEYLFIADVDFSMPVEELNRFLPPESSCDIVIGSREAPGAIRYNEPAYRHFIGRIYNLFIRTIVLPGLQDTQCGFKCFRTEVARKIFPYQTLRGWAFDVEILYIARLHGYTIQELGIPYYHNRGSRISVLRDSLRMFLDLWKIRMNARRGIYHARD